MMQLWRLNNQILRSLLFYSLLLLNKNHKFANDTEIMYGVLAQQHVGKLNVSAENLANHLNKFLNRIEKLIKQII